MGKQVKAARYHLDITQNQQNHHINCDFASDYIDPYDITTLAQVLKIMGTPSEFYNRNARNLLRRYGTFADIVRSGRIFEQPQDVLSRHEKVALSMLKAFHTRCLEPKFDEHINFKNFYKITYYLTHLVGSINIEKFYVVFLRTGRRYLKTQCFGVGAEYEVVYSIKEILKEALNIKAQYLVLCHNHPSGNMQPSSRDVSNTQYMQAAFSPFNIIIDEHLIVSGKKHFSFRQNDLLLPRR